MNKKSSIINVGQLVSGVINSHQTHEQLQPHVFDCDENGKTCLMHAALEGEYDLVRSLVSMGADVHAQDSNGENALFYATQMKNVLLGFDNKNIDVIKYLVLTMQSQKNSLQVLNHNNQTFLFRLFDHEKHCVSYAPELMDLFVTHPFGYVFGMAKKNKIAASHQDVFGKTFYQYLNNNVLREVVSPMITHWVSLESKKQMTACIDSTNKSSRVKKI